MFIPNLALYPMMRNLSLLLLLLCCISFAQAQDEIPPADPGKVLSPNQLDRYPWYYSLEEAMREPSKVYKLNLQDKKLKEFPQEILQLENLHMLDLSKNKLKELPVDIYKLPYLQYLNLYQNKVKALPDNFQYLGQLRTLFLGSNKLTTVPAWVGGLGYLRRLDLSFNNLTPYEIESIKYSLPKCDVTP